MHAEQERVDSLNYFNDAVSLTPVYLSCFATKQVVLLTDAVPVSTPYCLSSLLATSNQISRLGKATHESRVYGRTCRLCGPSNGKLRTYLAALYISFIYIYITRFNNVISRSLLFVINNNVNPI